MRRERSGNTDERRKGMQARGVRPHGSDHKRTRSEKRDGQGQRQGSRKGEKGMQRASPGTTGRVADLGSPGAPGALPNASEGG